MDKGRDIGARPLDRDALHEHGGTLLGINPLAGTALHPDASALLGTG